MDSDRAKQFAETLTREGFDVTIQYRGEQGREGPAKVMMLVTAATAAKIDLGSVRELIQLIDREQGINARLENGALQVRIT